MKTEKDKEWIECDNCKCLSQNIYEKGCDRVYITMVEAPDGDSDNNDQ